MTTNLCGSHCERQPANIEKCPKTFLYRITIPHFQHTIASLRQQTKQSSLKAVAVIASLRQQTKQSSLKAVAVIASLRQQTKQSSLNTVTFFNGFAVFYWIASSFLRMTRNDGNLSLLFIIYNPLFYTHYTLFVRLNHRLFLFKMEYLLGLPYRISSIKYGLDIFVQSKNTSP